MQNPEKGKKRTDKEEYTNDVMSLMLEVLILQVSYVDT